MPKAHKANCNKNYEECLTNEDSSQIEESPEFQKFKDLAKKVFQAKTTKTKQDKSSEQS